jgi:hypothetical protein
MTNYSKMIRMAAIAGIGAMTAMPASVQADQTARYALTIGMDDNGANVANPRLEVLAGGMATVEIGDDRTKIYNFSGQVLPTDKGTATVAFRYTIKGQDADGAATTQAVESTVELDYGQRVDLQFGKGEEASTPMTISLQVDVVQ